MLHTPVHEGDQKAPLCIRWSQEMIYKGVGKGLSAYVTRTYHLPVPGPCSHIYYEYVACSRAKPDGDLLCLATSSPQPYW